MFHDQKFSKNSLLKNSLLKNSLLKNSLLKNSLLKNSLLSSTTFSPKLKRGKQTKKNNLKAELSITTLLAPLLAALLAACSDTTYVSVGGTLNSSDDTTPESLAFNLYVLDGTIEGARVYVDENNNGQRDTNETLIGTTDENGRVSIAPEYAGETFLIDASNAFDLFTGKRLPDNTIYRAVSGNLGGVDVVASPISTLIETLKESDATLTEADILELIFNENTLIEIDDLNNPDNFILPVDEIQRPADSPLAIAEKIAQTSIQLQALIEQEAGDLAAVLAAIGESFDVTDDLNQTSQDTANARIIEARQRANGEPIANPVTGTNAIVNDDLTLAMDVWGFRDPVGNVDGDIPSEFTRLDIVSITDGSGMLVHVADDGIETEYGAGGKIPSEHFENLVFRPATDYLGSVQITYMVFDGEASSNEASLEITVNTFIVDDNTPVFTSETMITVDENTDANTAANTQGSATSIYLAEIEENSAHLSVSYSLLNTTDFGITSSTGNVWFRAPPDYETQSSYSFTVVARVSVDGSIREANHVVAVTIADVNDAPTLSATATGTIAENAPIQADTGVTLTPADDDGDTFDATDSFTVYEGASGADVSTRFGVSDDNGIYRLVLLANSSLDSLNESMIELRVKVNDGSNNGGLDSDYVTINVMVTNINAPVFTSGETATANENVAANDEDTQDNAATIYIALAPSASGEAVIYELSGTDDGDSFRINASGEVWFRAPPDHENKSSYSFTVVARVSVDGVELTTAREVTLTLNDLNDAAPEFASGDTASASATVAVNDAAGDRGAAVAIYKAIATPDGSLSNLVEYSLVATGDYTAFGINADGEVWFRQPPDYMTNPTYSFTVQASVTADGVTQTASQVVMVSENEAPSVTLDNMDVSVSEGGLVPGSTVIIHGIEFTAKPGTNPPGIKFTETNSGVDVLFFILMKSQYAEFFIYDTRTDSERVYTRDSIINHFNVVEPNITRYEAALVEAGTGGVEISLADLITGGDGSGFFAAPLVETAADLDANGVLSLDDDYTPVADLQFFVGNEDEAFSNITTEISVGENQTLAGRGASNILTASSYGMFTLTRTADATVTWSYTLNESAANGLGVGETATDSVFVRVLASDTTEGLSTVQKITVLINGRNDTPTADDGHGSYVITGTVTKDTPGETAKGEFIAADDLNDTLSYSVETQGAYGTLTLGTNGAWEYVLDNTDTTVDALVGGASASDTITLRATDSDDAYVERNVTITINGRTDVNGTDAGDSLGDATATLSQTIQGGDLDDTLIAGSGGDILIGGYGDDTLTLGAGTDTVIYRIASDTATVRADDGGDTINGFALTGTDKDKLVFVDTDTPLGSLSDLIALAKGDSPQLTVKLMGAPDNYTGFEFEFTAASKDDGPDGSGDASGSTLALNFASGDELDDTEVASLFGSGGLDTATNELTDTGLDNFVTSLADNFDLLALSDVDLTIL